MFLPITRGQNLFQIISDTMCFPEKPSLYCVFKYPKTYSSDGAGYDPGSVTVTGQFAGMTYGSLSLDVNEHKYTPNPLSPRTGFLSILLTDEKGSELEASLSSQGESYPYIIDHVRSLKTGDKVTVTGSVAVVPYEKCWDRNSNSYTCYVGLVHVTTIDGIDKASHAVLPWNLTDAQKTLWYLGEGLTKNSTFHYSVSFGDIVSDISDDTKVRRTNDSTLDLRLSFNARNASSNEWSVQLLLQGERIGVTADTCTFDEDSGQFKCNVITISNTQNRPLYVSLFLLGEHANKSNQKQLYPAMTRWAVADDFDIQRRFIDVFYDDEIRILGRTTNSTVLGWPHSGAKESDSKYWIQDGFPLPLKGDLYSSEVGKTQYFSFELLDADVKNT